jgi:RNA polymerase sigma factor (sigma-70 family)
MEGARRERRHALRWSNEVPGSAARELERLRRGERAACASFVDAHYCGVFRFFFWLTNDRDAAADLTQEAFAAFWESVREGMDAPDARRWLYGIARNRWRKRCRESARTGGMAPLDAALELADDRPGPEAEVLTGVEAETLRRAVSELPADYREALLLRALEELSYAEIGSLLGIAQGLARWRVHRARTLLGTAVEREREREREESSASA